MHLFKLGQVELLFENPVPTVLAAARQLGMAIKRDATLLWIADEAVIDELAERADDADPQTLAKDDPLSDEVVAYYTEVFEQRIDARPDAAFQLQQERSQTGTGGDGDLTGPKPEPDNGPSANTESMRTLGRKGTSSGQRRESMKSAKRERRRRNLDLREARLSGITERYTAEQAILSEESSSVSSTGASLGAPAMWPTAGARRRRFETHSWMPRIDSSSVALDQLCGKSPESAGSNGSTPSAAPPKSSYVEFNVGRRVEVDFDDEGWLRGVIQHVERACSVRSGNLVRYSVKLESGEVAEDVTMSEIRGIQDDASQSCGTDSHDANTRDDSLSAFEETFAFDDVSSDDNEHTSSMQCHVTDSGVEWTFIPERVAPVTWSPPTINLIRKHDGERFITRL